MTDMEDVRQLRFGFRRNLQGAIIDPTYQAAACTKRILEQRREALFGFMREQAGRKVSSIEEAAREEDMLRPELIGLDVHKLRLEGSGSS